MRLFVAVDVPDDPRLTSLLKRMDGIRGTRVPSPGSLHITLRFIGDVPRSMLPDIGSAISDAVSEGPIPVRIRSIGCFPGPSRPRVVWAGVEDSGALARTAARLEEGLVAAGVPREPRPFTPHLTIARLKEPQPRLMASLEDLVGKEFASFTADEVKLKDSVLSPSGAMHEDVLTVPLRLA